MIWTTSSIALEIPKEKKVVTFEEISNIKHLIWNVFNLYKKKRAFEVVLQILCAVGK